MGLSIKCRKAVLSVTVLLTASCSQGQMDSIQGTWEAVSGTAMGTKAEGANVWSMRITFRPDTDKATWEFTGNKKGIYEGKCRIDETKNPKEIDLFQPAATDPRRVLLGIYEIKDGMLTIAMDVERPKILSDPAMMKLVLKRLK